MAISAANLEVAFEGLEEAWRGTSCCEESSADAGWQDVRALDSVSLHSVSSRSVAVVENAGLTFRGL